MMKGPYLGRKFYQQIFAILLTGTVYSVSVVVLPYPFGYALAVAGLVALGCAVLGFMGYLFWRGWIEKPPPENSSD